MLESPSVARGTAAFSVRLDIRSGHPAERSTELRIEGIPRPTGRIGYPWAISDTPSFLFQRAFCENAPPNRAECSASKRSELPRRSWQRLHGEGHWPEVREWALLPLSASHTLQRNARHRAREAVAEPTL